MAESEETRPIEVEVEGVKKEEIEATESAERAVNPAANESIVEPEPVEIEMEFILDLLRLAGMEYHGQTPSEIIAFREGGKVGLGFYQGGNVIAVGIVPDCTQELNLIVNFMESFFVHDVELIQSRADIYPFEGEALSYYLELMGLFGITDPWMLNDPFFPTDVTLTLVDETDDKQPETETPAESSEAAPALEVGDVPVELEKNELGMTKQEVIDEAALRG